jgi:hypothetical protein
VCVCAGVPARGVPPTLALPATPLGPAAPGGGESAGGGGGVFRRFCIFAISERLSASNLFRMIDDFVLNLRHCANATE